MTPSLRKEYVLMVENDDVSGFQPVHVFPGGCFSSFSLAPFGYSARLRVGIIHKKPKEGGISAVGGTGSIYTFYGTSPLFKEMPKHRKL